MKSQEGPSSPQRHWLAIESFDNWRVDEANGFKFTGVSEARARRASEVRQGDLIFTYVPSPHCAFADVRRVGQSGLARSQHTRNYDIPCASGVVTLSAASSKPGQWVEMRTLVERLSFIRNPSKWGYALRNSFREITVNDALMIASAMVERNPAGHWAEIVGEIAARKWDRSGAR